MEPVITLSIRKEKAFKGPEGEGTEEKDTDEVGVLGTGGTEEETEASELTDLEDHDLIV